MLKLFSIDAVIKRDEVRIVSILPDAVSIKTLKKGRVLCQAGEFTTGDIFIYYA